MSAYHPSAEILIILWVVYHEQTTKGVKLWQKVSCSSKKIDNPRWRIFQSNPEKGVGKKFHCTKKLHHFYHSYITKNMPL